MKVRVELHSKLYFCKMYASNMNNFNVNELLNPLTF